MKKRISQEEWIGSEEIFSTTFLTIDLIRKYCAENVWVDVGIALNIFLFYAKCASIQETKQVFATDKFVADGLGYSRETILKYRNILQTIWCIEKIIKREWWKMVWHYVKIKYSVCGRSPTMVDQPLWSKPDTNTDLNKDLNADVLKELNTDILSKDNNSNELNYEKEENYQINEIANTNNITDEQYLEEANTERRIETFWEEWYENEYDYQAEEYSQDILDKAIQQMKGNLPKEQSNTTHIQSNARVDKVEKEVKVWWNRDIALICDKFKELCEEYWYAYNSINDRKAAKRLTGKPFFENKIKISWCEDLICYIESIFEWNPKLWEYWYQINWPQPFFYNAEKVYNKLKMWWKWNTLNSPAKARFEEFISSYPKREWIELALQWYITNVKNVELHNEILDWTKEMIKEITKSGKELTYLKAANTYLNEARRKDYLVSTMMTDDKAYKIAYDCWDSEMFRNHLKKKYWAEWATSHWLIFSELKNALMQKEWQNWADN